jgi:His/Glu/Gln/Arg/opine family amino acid ABC transporter permease subunit
MSEFQDSFYKTFVQDDRYLTFLNGLKTTLYIAFFATLIGIALGILVAVVKVLHHRMGDRKGPAAVVLKALNAVGFLYTTVVRGTPVVVQLMILYFIVFTFISSGANVAIIGFGINSGAYVSEIVRAGILSIDKGQTEAGRSLGLSETTTMGYIVLPQAVKNILPALFNEFITLLKETSIVGYIAVIDLTKAGDLVRARTAEAFFSLCSVALIYLVMVVALTLVQRRLEQWLGRGDRR